MKTARLRTLSLIALTAAVVVVTAPVPGAHAQEAPDFFSALFGGVTQPRPEPSPRVMRYNDDRQSSPVRYGGRGAAYCVRTCDGRYFPISANNEQSRAEACKSMCPASETKVYYGSSIDYATSDNGRSYSSLPNAFK